MPRIQLEDDHYCFACGLENPHGLRIRWLTEGKTARGEFVPERKFQGWKGIVHGGILATLLDEAMTRLSWLGAGGALTAEMRVRFLRPARVGEKLFVTGEITAENRRVVEMRAAIRQGRPDGPRIAAATGKAVKVRPPSKNH